MEREEVRQGGSERKRERERADIHGRSSRKTVKV
jgi:hypothetical protein